MAVAVDFGSSMDFLAGYQIRGKGGEVATENTNYKL
jgi:hypothetical protein